MDNVAGRKAPEVSPRRASNRRRRWPMVVLVVAMVVAGLVVVDRLAATYAGSRVRPLVATQLDDRGIRYDEITVSLAGFPFLTQVAAGHYDQLTVDIVNVSAEDLRLSQLHLVAAGIDADVTQLARDAGKVTAERVHGTGVLSYPELAGLIAASFSVLSDVELTSVAHDVALTANANVNGVQIPVSAKVNVSLTTGQLTAALKDVRVAGTPPTSGTATSGTATSAITAHLSRLARQPIRLPMPELPYGLIVTSIDTDPSGIRITAEARDVLLAS